MRYTGPTSNPPTPEERAAFKRSEYDRIRPMFLEPLPPLCELEDCGYVGAPHYHSVVMLVQNCVCGLSATDPGRLGVEPGYNSEDRSRWEKMTPDERRRWSDDKIGAERCSVCGRSR